MLADISRNNARTALHLRAATLDGEAFAHRAAGRFDEARAANLAARDCRDEADAMEVGRWFENPAPAAADYPLSERGLPMAFKRDSRFERTVLVIALLSALAALVMIGGMA
jgi:hypothetical protein